MKTISRYIMTLALLLTAVTGAWAEEATITLSCGTTEKTFEKAELPWSSTAAILKEVISDLGMGPGIQSITGGDGKVVKNGNENFQVTGTFSGKATVVVSYVNTSFTTTTATITVTAPAAEPAIDFKWDAATKTGTFTMPAFDVEIAPIYAPKAVFATDGNLVLIPTAVEGVYAESTDAIVKAGTVANIGETEKVQGEVMYAITSTNQATAPALTAFSADVPTAKDITVGSEVLVWYYIKGADTPDGQEATAENTFNDSEICATPITVTVLSNKFDITFKAANDNTIETGKATVKVGDEAAEVKEGKLTGVKMDSKVSVTAKEGYKFRKVEVKKNDGSKSLDESTVGMIVCTNGKAYPVNMKDNLPSGVTAVGIVAYKNGKNGLVMALTDEATNMNWDTATGNNGAKAHTPAVEGYSWKVPAIGEWQYNIFSGAGVGNLAGLSTYMTAAGGTGLQNGCYWTSTPKNNSYYARCIQIENGSINFGPGGNTELKSNGYHVRAVFAF